MSDPKDNWPADLRKQWDATWSLPHMQAGLEEIKRRIKPQPVPLIIGYDALVLAAGAHHKAIGCDEILNHIEEMRAEKKQQKPLPQAFTPEARGEKPTEAL